MRAKIAKKFRCETWKQYARSERRELLEWRVEESQNFQSQSKEKGPQVIASRFLSMANKWKIFEIDENCFSWFGLLVSLSITTQDDSLTTIEKKIWW